MRRATILLAAVAVMVSLAAGMALAQKNISCAMQEGKVCLGTNRSDNITGTNRADTIKARGGKNDTVTARGGNDKVFGQSGPDFLDGGPGNDTLNAGLNVSGQLEGVAGGAGNDTLVESAGPDRFIFGPDWGNDQISGDGDQISFDNDDVCFACGIGSLTSGVTINLATGQAFETAGGSTGPNTVTWTPGIIEYAVGSAAGDTITGSTRSNVVNGQLGADTINVSGGNDFVNCGGDSATDTVTRDTGDLIIGDSCNGDTITTVP